MGKYTRDFTEERRINVLVHERIMGACAHTVEIIGDFDEDGNLLPPALWGDYPTKRCTKCGAEMGGLLYQVGVPTCPDYATDLSAAYRVVQRLREAGYSFGLWDVIPDSQVLSGIIAAFRLGASPPDWRLPETGTFFGHGDTPTLAICRAALMTREDWKA